MRIMKNADQENIVIVVHGGAWNIPESLLESTRTGVEAAVREGWQVLIAGGSALDAVEAAVNHMEDNPLFDAGIGAALTRDGDVELDAIIMDGKTLSAGAVAGITHIQNPVSLARKVMEKTSHVMLIADGALKFAKEIGFPLVKKETLITDEALLEWKRFHSFNHTIDELFSHDTVGAVALDKEGNIAAATSTGGITAKMPGRVGDSPIIGSGAYADNKIGGASATGHGESIMKVTLTRHAVYLLEQGLSAQKAAENSLHYMFQRVHGFGGLILLDRVGNVGIHFTTTHMPWAYIKNGNLYSGV